MDSWGRHPESPAGAGPHDLSGVSGKVTFDLGLDHWKMPAGRQQTAKASSGAAQASRRLPGWRRTWGTILSRFPLHWSEGSWALRRLHPLST